jgi:hypothetical protein
MVSPYCSAVKRNVFFAPYRLFMACRHSFATMIIDEYSGHDHFRRSAAELNVLAAPFAKMPVWVQKVLWPLDDTLRRAHDLVAAALNPEHPDNKSGKTLPHDTALNLLLLVRFKQKLGGVDIFLEDFVREALALEPAILKEADQKMARRQLVRILFDAGVFYRHLGRQIHVGRFRGENKWTLIGADLMYRAYELSRGLTVDQRRKIEKAL